MTARKFSIAIASLCAVMALYPSSWVRPALAEDDGPYAVKGAIVPVTVKGVLTAQGNSPVAIHGTGFFTNKDGMLVTAYHLRRQLGIAENDESVVTYEAQVGPNAGDIVPATQIFNNPTLDVMVLYVQKGERDIRPLVPNFQAANTIKVGKTDVYTGGYPNGYNFSVDRGIIKSTGGIIKPPLPAWTTSLSFKEGQSGSPILLENNTVIAIARGNDADASTIGILIPIKYIPREYFDETLVMNDAAAKSLQSNKTDDLKRIVVEKTAAVGSTISRTKPFHLANTACAPATNQRFTIPASEGSKIDPDSIQLRIVSLQGSVSYSVATANATGFDIAARLENSGVCNQTSSAQRIAEIVGLATYNEITGTQTDQAVTVVDATAIGNVSLPVPGATNQYSYTAVSAAGERRQFQPTKEELVTKNGVPVLDTVRALSRVFPDQ